MRQIAKRWCTLIILVFIVFIGLDWFAQLAIEYNSSESLKLEGLVKQVTAWSLFIIAIAFGLIGIGATVFWVVESWLPDLSCLTRLRSEFHYPRLLFWIG